MAEFYYYFYAIFFFIIGSCIGSFANVVIYRYPKIILEGKNGQLSLSYPPSHCTNCQNKILKRDNIPIISWLIRLGKCRFCKKSFSIRYMITELFFAVIFLLSILFFYPKYDIERIISILILFSYLYCIFFIDLKYFLIPNAMSIPLIIMGIIFSWLKIIPVPVIESFLGSLTLFMIIAITGYTYKKIRNIEGIGYGDYKLLAVGGAWCGLLNVQYILILSSVLGLIFYLLNKYIKISSIDGIEHMNDLADVKKSIIPFGPAICLSILANVFFVLLIES